MQYRVSKKMSPVKMSAEAFRKDDQRVLKNKDSNNSSVATSCSSIGVCKIVSPISYLFKIAHLHLQQN
jgi:hypothetical protein